MGQAIARYYAAAPGVPRRIFTSAPPEDSAWLEKWLGERRGGRVRIVTPARGIQRSFLDTVIENARHAWEGRFGSGPGFGSAVQESLREILDLDAAPVRIEGFDVSHVQGTDTSASIVVWEGTRPRRSAWRRLKIQAPTRGDDYAALGEAVRRRYSRLIREAQPLPDLVLIDGGRGQLGAASQALEALGITTLPIIALAKRAEEIFVPGREEPIRLPADSPALHLLTRIRDEAHRFAVSYHRRRRSRRTLATVLTGAPGIGPRRARALLSAFGSVDGVRRAGEEDLRRVIGPSAARALRRFLVGQTAERRA
jgi:excinuclease ABC subunit C